MFTGIIRHKGIISKIIPEGKNLRFVIESTLASKIRVDESISHNGVCLTITNLDTKTYEVTAVEETICKTNLGHLRVGDEINLEQAMKLGDRLDGHMVQGHIDALAVCSEIKDRDGSFEMTFRLIIPHNGLLIEKGSIAVNGVSLTCYNISPDSFCISVIPFTWEHTNLRLLKLQDKVNIEYDMLGKYIHSLYKFRTP